MKGEDKDQIYQKLAEHFNKMAYSYPPTPAFQETLKARWSIEEAMVGLALPVGVAFEVEERTVIAKKAGMEEEKVKGILERLADEGVVYYGTDKRGKKGYGLLPFSPGYVQTPFWKGEISPEKKRMLQLFSALDREGSYTRKTPGTPSAKFIPINKVLHGTKTAIVPATEMSDIIEKAEVIAVAHCPCRVRSHLLGNECHHTVENCIHYNEIGRYMIERGFGREIDKEEALRIVREAEEEGLFHLGENCQLNMQSTCCCCPCCCWAVKAINYGAPRDHVIATYYMRDTVKEECTGCGDCVEPCPVHALEIRDNLAFVNERLCIGCGICLTKCNFNAAYLKKREDTIKDIPLDFTDLQKRLLMERER